MKKPIINSKISGILVFAMFTGLINLNGANDSIRNSFAKEKNPNSKLQLMLKSGRMIEHTNPMMLKEIGDAALQLSIILHNREAETEAILLNSLYYFHKDNYDSAIALQYQALKIADEINNDTLRSLVYFQLCLSKQNVRKYHEAIDYGKQALKYYRKIKSNRLGGVYNNMASAFSNLRQYDSAIFYYMQAIRAGKTANKDTDAKGIILGNIGLEYYNKADYKSSIKFYRQAISILKSNNSDVINLALNYVNLGVSFRQEKQPDSALHYFKMAKSAYQNIKSLTGVARASLNMGNLLVDMGKFREAEKSYRESLQICQSVNLTIGIVMNYINLGSMYIKESEPATALRYFRMSDSLDDRADGDIRLAILEGLYQSNKLLGNTSKALNYLEQHVTLRDSLNTMKYNLNLADIQAQYQQEISDIENKRLRNENQLKQHSIEHHQTINNIFVALIIILIIATLLIIWSRHKLKKLYYAIETKSNTIRAQSLELELANNTKDKLFSIIAHDLRNPFNNILGIADIIEEETRNLPEKEFNEYAKIIQKSGKIAYDLLENLLTWSKAQRGLIKPDNSQVNLHSLSEAIITNHIQQAKKGGIELINHIPENTIIWCDEDMLKTTIRNITTNSLKYTPAGGNITYSAQIYDNHITISIIDTGRGMSEEQVRYLFDFKSKLSHYDNRQSQSSGLGLMICFEFIQLMKGEISAHSTPGQGTIVSISLPVNKY